MARVTRSMPSLVEVTRRLREAGQTAVALNLVRAFGVKELAATSTMKPAKYVREKNRYAYIHVGVAASSDQQCTLLSEFVKQVRGRDELAALPEPTPQHLLRIALPGAKVVYAYRVPLEQYQRSALPSILKESKIFEAYTRKPRADAQHHVTAGD